MAEKPRNRPGGGPPADAPFLTDMKKMPKIKDLLVDDSAPIRVIFS